MPGDGSGGGGRGQWWKVGERTHTGRQTPTVKCGVGDVMAWICVAVPRRLLTATARSGIDAPVGTFYRSPGKGSARQLAGIQALAFVSAAGPREGILRSIREEMGGGSAHSPCGRRRLAPLAPGVF